MQIVQEHRAGKRNCQPVYQIVLALSLFCFPLQSNAQPTLEIARIVNNWPTIELYFKMKCDDTLVTDLKSEDISIYEDGIEQGVNTLWCPGNWSYPCYPHLVFVFAIENEANLLEGKQLARLLVDQFGLYGYGDLLWLKDGVEHTPASIGSNEALIQSISKVPTSDTGKVLDQILFATVRYGPRLSDCPVPLIVLTDQSGSEESTTLQEVVYAMSLRNVHCHIVNVGDVGTSPNLEVVADTSDGKYFDGENPFEVVEFYPQLFTSMQIDGSQYDLECLTTYQGYCLDGSEREVTLTVIGACGDTLSATKTFSVPKDTGRFLECTANVESKYTVRDAPFTLDVGFYVDSSVLIGLERIELDVAYDTSLVQHNGIDYPDSSPITSANVSYQQTGYGLHVTLQRDQTVFTPGEYMKLVMERRVSLPDSILVSTYTSPNPTRCVRPGISESTIYFIDPDSLPVAVQGELEQCSPGVVTLTVPDGYASYRWSHSDTNRSTSIVQSGEYVVQATTQEGVLYQSDTIHVVIHEAYNPEVQIIQTVISCDSGYVVLGLAGTFSSYFWSDSTMTALDTVRVNGTYSVTVVDSNGCSQQSDDITISDIPPQPPVVSGARTACADWIFPYQIEEVPGTLTLWEIQGGRIVYGDSTSRILVLWENDTAGIVRLNAYRDSCVFIEEFSVDLSGPDSVPIRLDGPYSICPNDSTFVETDTGYAYTLWPNYYWGGHRRKLLQGGVVYVDAGNDPACLTRSDTIIISEYPAPSNRVDRRADTLVARDGVHCIWYFRNKIVENENRPWLVVTEEGYYSVTIINEHGCTSFNKEIPVWVLGNDIVPESESLFAVYPTATDDLVNLEYSLSHAVHVTISIRDILGRLQDIRQVGQLSGDGTLQLNLGSLRSGIYFIRIVTPTGSTVTKVYRK